MTPDVRDPRDIGTMPSLIVVKLGPRTYRLAQLSALDSYELMSAKADNLQVALAIRDRILIIRNGGHKW